ncbi:inovirus Gp2 family protein [Vibrio splendidus]|uniref:inovirus Gp2 family protein n=1 Tax=Vibrio splendidus TaxID=29497 RepID=UPI002468D92D|nr:inovirus Gp2 family protein [Vibrio splendidus]MDH5938684.1 inovirus Gp2 family protein [Vibrio splendidus]
MRRRLPTNPNLSLFEDEYYKNIPVLTNYGPLAEPYLEKIKSVFDKALEEYSRVYVLRFDLRFPSSYLTFDSDHISKFIASLKAKIHADLKRKNKLSLCDLRFVWAKEKDSSDNPHYHVAIFLNKDVYFTHGKLSAEDGNLSAMINHAWSSALSLFYHELVGCVNFPSRCSYWVDRKNMFFNDQYNDCFKRLSYLAKVKTKIFQGSLKNFGGSYN